MKIIVDINLKIIVDSFLYIKIITTLLSSFHLKNAFWEPLVWRKFTFKVYPKSSFEVINKDNFLEFVL